MQTLATTYFHSHADGLIERSRVFKTSDGYTLKIVRTIIINALYNYSSASFITEKEITTITFEPGQNPGEWELIDRKRRIVRLNKKS